MTSQVESDPQVGHEAFVTSNGRRIAAPQSTILVSSSAQHIIEGLAVQVQAIVKDETRIPIGRFAVESGSRVRDVYQPSEMGLSQLEADLVVFRHWNWMFAEIGHEIGYSERHVRRVFLSLQSRLMCTRERLLLLPFVLDVGRYRFNDRRYLDRTRTQSTSMRA